SFVVQGVLTGVRAERTPLAQALSEFGDALEFAGRAATLEDDDLTMATARLLHAASKLSAVRADVRLALERPSDPATRHGLDARRGHVHDTTPASQVGPLLASRLSAALDAVLAETRLRSHASGGAASGRVVAGYRLEELIA